MDTNTSRSGPIASASVASFFLPDLHPEGSVLGASGIFLGRPWATIIKAASASGVRSNRQGAVAVADHGKPAIDVIPKPMIKAVFLLTKVAEISAQEFHRYWTEVHALVIRNNSAAMRMRKYFQSHIVPSPITDALIASRGWGANPYQGIAEVWWENEEDMTAAFATPEGAEAGARVIEDEKKFLGDDVLVMMTREYQIFDRTQ